MFHYRVFADVMLSNAAMHTPRFGKILKFRGTMRFIVGHLKFRET
jgi:hypothetical protein